MRIRSSVVSAAVLIISILATIQPIAAAPARPYAIEDCLDFPNSPWVVCYQEQGVVQLTESATGNTTYVVNADRCYQDYYNGDLVSEYCGKSRHIVHRKEGEFHVYRTRASDERIFEIDGVTYTCTNSYVLIFANGDIHQEESQSSCTPPL